MVFPRRIRELRANLSITLMDAVVTQPAGHLLPGWQTVSLGRLRVLTGSALRQPCVGKGTVPPDPAVFP